MKETACAAIGFIAAPLVPAVTLAFLTLPQGGSLEVYVISMLGWLVIGYLVAGTVTLLIGVPLFLLLRHFGLVRWWLALLVGFLTGVGVTRLLAAGGFAQPGYLMLWGASGALAALLFWAIWMAGQRAAAR